MKNVDDFTVKQQSSVSSIKWRKTDKHEQKSTTDLSVMNDDD